MTSWWRLSWNRLNALHFSVLGSSSKGIHDSACIPLSNMILVSCSNKRIMDDTEYQTTKTLGHSHTNIKLPIKWAFVNLLKIKRKSHYFMMSSGSG